VAYIVEVLLDRLKCKSTVLDDLSLMPCALEELERDFLVDDVCGRKREVSTTLSAGEQEAERRLGKSARPARRRKRRRTVLSKQNLESRIRSTLRRYPVARLKGRKERVRHVLSIRRRFDAVGDTEVEAVLEVGTRVSVHAKKEKTRRKRTLRLSCGICGVMRTRGMYRKCSTSRRRSTTES
jgi:hypothetical protein